MTTSDDGHEVAAGQIELKRSCWEVLSRVPPTFFAISFGLAGLAVVWRLMAAAYGSPAAVADVLFLASGVVWALLLAGALTRVLGAPREILAELRDPILTPFWALPTVVGMLLAAGLQPHAPGVAKVLFVIFLAATVIFGGWLTGQWIVVPLDQTKLHVGYLLPTVAGGLVGAQCAASFGLRGIGWLSFGIGIVCWLMLGSLILNRLFFIATLPGALVPTLAIELAPPAIAGSAYFELHGPALGAVAYGLAGYAVLMALVQLRLLPSYARLRFSPGFWSFTFPWCAAVGLALRWLRIERPPGQAIYAGLAAGGVSLLVAGVAVRSVVAIRRSEFVPGARSEPLASRAAPVSTPWINEPFAGELKR
jgi:tellurite resistance protein